ncbi:MAG: sulfurtransferase complex subunit TusB [Gammaproteobacteria bacterium]|nr:MAG: sulfurtransferase complex subunit TusB [Gammaproteobacteria bacterium]
MSILHLVRTSAYQHDDLAQCLQVYSAEDTIVLMDDGCYNLAHPLLKQVSSKRLLIIIEHCQARAVTFEKNKQAIVLAQLTPLLFSHDSVITWQ